MVQYRAIAKLGHGGMAEVRLAIAQRTGGFNKLLVLKILREELAAESEFLEMFLAEARVAALLNHPNIVQTNEVGQDSDGQHFIAMEYLEGQPLNALITRLKRKGMPLDVHVFILAEVLRGLHYAHELTDLNGTPLALIHRDVSPQNAFLTYTGQVKLLDFGIAKVAGAAALTKTGILKGKLAYMAPEQARMATNIDRRADLFAVGVMLWEAVALQRFVPSGEPEIATIQNRINGEDKSLAEAAPDADPTLAAICNKAVAHKPEDRWPDAQSFAEALEAWLPRSKHVLEKELATLLSDNFREERSRIRRVVEEQIAKPPTSDISLSGLRELAPATLDSKPGVQDVSSGRSGVATTEVAPTEPKQRWFRWTLGLALVTAAAGGAFVFRPRPAAVPATVVPSAADVPHSTRIVVRTTPSNATITVDNGSPRSAPVETTVPKDDSRHELRVAAEGYETDVRTVSFASDVDLQVTLKKVATETASSASASAAPTPKAAPPPAAAPVAPAFVGRPRPVVTGKPVASQTEEPVVTPAAPAPRKPRRAIDETDPYAK